MNNSFLSRIESPDDVKKLNNDELNALCSEIRETIISTVSENGGHLASSLGAVELTVAIHRCFNSPDDAIVFDVGHQCYTHKLLTGRYKDFSTLRKENGISGFMRPEESVHDPFVSGHSSTSVSSAYGVCRANAINGKSGFAVAVLGDGALTGGMVYEAFNNVNSRDKGLIVILNDNKMSISKNRGALSRHLGNIRSHKNYFRFKSDVEKFLLKIPLIGRPLRSLVFHFKLMLKNAIYNSNIFESLGFYYMGPVDGHDITKMTEIFSAAKEQNRPVLIHVKTQKGKGYQPAEEKPWIYHGVSHFDAATGVADTKKVSFSSVFGDTMCRLAETDLKICAVTAAMTFGTGLKEFSEKHKDRFFDVGIAEEHAVTFSAALAKKGLKPVFAVYSTFLQRGFDQVIHDVAIAGLPLTLAVDRAGLVGEDGETHQGLFDVSYLSIIPGVKIYAPSGYNELSAMLEERLSAPCGVAAIRYPRGAEPSCADVFSYDGSEFTVFGSSDTAVIAYGTLVADALAAKESLMDEKEIAVVKLNIINPVSDSLLNTLSEYKNILFFEESILSGSVSERIGCKLMKSGFSGIYRASAIEGFVKQATVKSQKSSLGIDKDSMIKTVREVTGIVR